MIERLKKLTRIVILAGIGIFIVYDIVIVIIGGKDPTLSNIMFTWLWQFPFLAYAWGVITGHFTSVIKSIFKGYKGLWFLIPLSIIEIVLSIVLVSKGIRTNPILPLIIGFFAGTFFWNQRKEE